LLIKPDVCFHLLIAVAKSGSGANRIATRLSIRLSIHYRLRKNMHVAILSTPMKSAPGD